MKPHIFKLGRLMFTVEVGSRGDWLWWINSDNCYRHTYLFSAGWVTSYDDISVFVVHLGPLQVSLGWV